MIKYQQKNYLFEVMDYSFQLHSQPDEMKYISVRK